MFAARKDASKSPSPTLLISTGNRLQNIVAGFAEIFDPDVPGLGQRLVGRRIAEQQRQAIGRRFFSVELELELARWDHAAELEAAR